MGTRDAKADSIWLVRAIGYVVYGFIIVSELILVQGFLLLLLGANPGASYVDWAYRSLGRVMNPFRGIFTPITFNGDSILDTSVLFAMVVYAIAMLVMREVIVWLTHRLQRQQRQTELDAALAAARANQPYPSVTSDGTQVIVPTVPPPPATSAPTSDPSTPYGSNP